MEQTVIHNIPYPGTESHPHYWPLFFVRQIEKLKLQHRADKYRYKEDPGGIAYLRQHVKPHSIVFDIGAHKGGYLHFLLEQLAGTGKIFAFEPQVILYQYLLKLQQLLGWQQVVIEPYAVSDQQGTALLCIPYNQGRNSSPCATIINSKMHFRFRDCEKVPTVSIDAYCKKQGVIPDFIKVDVEGNELMVFRGAEETLRKYHPRLLFECEARFVGAERVAETFAFLQQLGYSGYFIEQQEIHPIHLFDIWRHQEPGAASYCNNFIFE
jgi:FkbM family methyltransferase